jgi:hypothetical protein
MGLKAGTLLWNRRRLVLDPAEPKTLLVDTGLIQQNTSFPDYSPNEPTMGQTLTVPPGAAPLGPPPSRVHVIPLAPLGAWALVAHSEPFINTTTGTIHVQFGVDALTELNVLFWDPHSIVGPGQADSYNPLPR